MRSEKIFLAVGLGLVLLGMGASPARGEEPTDSQAFVPPTYEYQSLTSQPQPADYWQQVGTNAVIVGDYPNAIAALDKAIDLTDARQPELLEQRGWVHYRLGNENMALADLRAAATLYLTEESYQDYANAQNMLEFIDS